MKSDQDVRMISAETPVIFARACEMFIMDITIRSIPYAEYDNDRMVLTKKSILDTIKNTDIFDFLMEIRWNTSVCMYICFLFCAVFVTLIRV